MTQSKLTQAEYIQHHLHHLQFNLHTMTFANSDSFWVLNVDTLAMSFFLGVVFLTFFYIIARRAVSGVPGKVQNFIEFAVDAIHNIVTEYFRADTNLIGPMALTIFVWVFLMNFMDLIPVDLVPRFLGLFGVPYFKAVPTADPMQTFSMSITVFFLIIYYNFKGKGAMGLLKEILSKPFGWYLFPINIAFRVIEDGVKPISLALRLFGNLFAGELVFILIATMPWWVQWGPGFLWSMLHVLVIIVQAFIFMMLTIVYLSMAYHEH